MNLFLLLSAIVILACVLCNRLSSKLGVPTLLAFILLGMFFGCDGVVKIPFENYTLAQNICSVALIFIMFYGGFGTNWAQARPVAVKATVLSSLGTLGTAGLVGLFCWKVLGLEMLLGFLLGAVIASTDAASVFSILRSKHLDLKEGTASLLEVESGSNDPFSYMLTVILLSLMSGSVSVPAFVYQVFAQLVYGGALGVLIALAARKFLQCFRFSTDGFDAVFLVAVALLSYVLPTLLGGNGYLSVYLTGILLGNSPLRNKQGLVSFFDGVTGLMQMVLFFLLGLLAFPSQLPSIAPTALAVALFLTFVARPVVVFLLMAPFRSSLGQILLVAWSGMRGAASIVFSILVITDPAEVSLDLYHIVFFIVLFSILLQGSLIPVVAKKLKMTDSSANVMKTFTDYTDEIPVQFLLYPHPRPPLGRKGPARAHPAPGQSGGSPAAPGGEARSQRQHRPGRRGRTHPQRSGRRQDPRGPSLRKGPESRYGLVRPPSGRPGHRPPPGDPDPARRRGHHSPGGHRSPGWRCSGDQRPRGYHTGSTLSRVGTPPHSAQKKRPIRAAFCRVVCSLIRPRRPRRHTWRVWGPAGGGCWRTKPRAWCRSGRSEPSGTERGSA